MSRLTAAVLAGALLAATAAGAQTKTGTTIGQFLSIEPGARHAAMGNAGVGLAGGIESVWFNPGVLGTLEGSAVTFTHSSWFADIGYDYAAAALAVGGLGNLLAAVTTLNSGDIDVRTVDQPLGTGERYDVGNTALSLGYGRLVTSRFAVGLQFNYVHERIWHTSFSTLTASAGTVYRLDERGTRLGFSLSNLGTRASFSGRDLAIQYDPDPDEYGDNSALPAEQLTDEFPVPLVFRLGLSVPYRFSENSELLVVVDALHPNDNAEALNLGAEWTVQKVLALRAGYQTLFQPDSELGLTLGFGINLSGGRLRFGYAWADHEYLEATHRMTLAVGL
jgi:hypothetical protein